MINTLAQDREKHKEAHEEKIKLLRAKIDEYLKPGNNVGDPVAQSLLKEVKATL